MKEEVVGYSFKQNFFKQQILQVKIKTRELCGITFTEGPEYITRRDATREESDFLLSLGSKDSNETIKCLKELELEQTKKKNILNGKAI